MSKNNNKKEQKEKPEFIRDIDDRVPVPLPVNWNMTNSKFSMAVTEQLLWSAEDIQSFANQCPNGHCEPKISPKGTLACPLLAFIPYPKNLKERPSECWLACYVYYLNLNEAGKLVTGQAQTPHRVAVLASPSANGGVVDSYLVQSALLAAFTPNDRIRPVQADKWQVMKNGSLVNLAKLLGFDKSAFSTPKRPAARKEKKSMSKKATEPRGLGALQNKFTFSPKFADDEAAVIADLESKLPGTTVRRWLFSRQPVTKVARSWLLTKGERMSYSEVKSMAKEDLEDQREYGDLDDSLVSKKSKSKQKASKKDDSAPKKQKKDKRDHSPVRKLAKKALESNSDILAVLQKQVMDLIQVNQSVAAQLSNGK